ncbi:MAG TPA: methionine adenosyltransferase [Ignavibacteriales bacterium]|nr:methionine adenosyltransferase [Ignavibacteriales bacterium]HOL82175.1 methionine adenosyltransferase [Ignavibacteriales bacterium]HOM65755.1 methionine adenosyltransferase [Ignavibacteriales bacterium]HPD67610.1 methionine adenosyltransferase [Ignavibacteriales bacterium]HPP34303.1 methionine adenosyltransferase [Ignavibacteriales bacterium]
MSYFFTSESVSEGHPDKVADAISDGVLDACLREDLNSRVACETLVTTGLVVVAGEITTKAYVDIQDVVRGIIKKIGYNKGEYKFEAESCGILNAIHSQSPDIAMGVDTGGAGDQGMMFGYACDQTPELMPMPIVYAHKLMKKLADIRHNELELMPYLRPDSKSQVTIEYDDNGQPKRVDTIVISTQHDPDATQARIKEDVLKYVIPAVIPEQYLDKDLKVLVNPTGRFEIGGPHGDSGLTGRKIIVDTYGGWAPHGGGAFSGKDPSKVDRSAAYATRHIAKNIVAAKLAKECMVQVAYAIGVAEPVSIFVDTKGTGAKSDKEIAEIIRKEVDMTPKGIISRLDLKRPIYSKTVAYGHFGRNENEFTWEKLDLVDKFQKYL